MKKLLNKYNVDTILQYFEIIEQSWREGNYSQGDREFTALPNRYRKLFVSTVVQNRDEFGHSFKKIEILINSL